MTGETDGFFGFLVGLYAAALVAPAVTVGVALRVTTDAAALYLTLLGTAVVTTASVGYLARSERLAVRLGRVTGWVWAAAVVPFGYGALLFVIGAEGGSSVAVAASMLVTIGGLFVGMGLAAAAHNRHAKAAIADAEEYARFDARRPARERTLVTVAVGLLMSVGAVGFLASFVVELESFRWLFNLCIAAGAALVGANAERTVAVTDSGLLVGNPIHKRLRPWSAFESFSLSRDSLVIHRAKWSPRGVRDVRCDPAEIENLDAVEDALATVLPRRGR